MKLFSTILIAVVAFLILIQLIFMSDRNTVSTGAKIDSLLSEVELATAYAKIDDLDVCRKNLVRIDSLHDIINIMLEDTTLSYDHEHQLIDLIIELKHTRFRSSIPLTLDSIQNY